MSLLDTHLEQIELCSLTILDLPFPKPKIFTNAILHTNDITALIRDTEYHERALFSILPPSELSSIHDKDEDPARRSTAFDVNEEGLGTNSGLNAPRRNKVVAAVLGGDMADRIRREQTADASSSRRTGQEGLNIELLLKSAEKLCAVYPMPGALDRISAVRGRYNKAMTSIVQHEELVASQSAQLRSMSRSATFDVEDTEDDVFQNVAPQRTGEQRLTYEDIQREEESVRELERRKRTLEERVSGMEKDLGGILR